MFDYHIHTSHSIDAEGSPRDYCERALVLGLKEICFTNHCELDRARNDNLIRFNGEIMPITNDGLLRLQNEVINLKSYFSKKGLDVRFGIEVGFFDGVENRLREITAGLEFDYVLAGIHCLEHICIDSSKEYRNYFTKNSVAKLLDKYFSTMEVLIRSRVFDSIAHFDVYKKYGLEFYGDEIKIFNKERVFYLLELIAQYETGLEINTAGLRKINDFYPSAEFIKLAKDAGVEIITVGSDAHNPEDLGKGIPEAIEYAKSYGFKRVYGFNKRRKLPLDIS